MHAPQLGLEVFTVLLRPSANDPSERVRAAATEALEILRRHSHAKFGRMAALGAIEHEIAAEERRADEGRSGSSRRIAAGAVCPFGRGVHEGGGRVAGLAVRDPPLRLPRASVPTFDLEKGAWTPRLAPRRAG